MVKLPNFSSMVGIPLILVCLLIAGSTPEIERIDPPCWWTHLGLDTLELLVEGDLSNASMRIEGIGLRQIWNTPASNPRNHYIGIELNAATPAQQVRIIATGDVADTAFFEIRERAPLAGRNNGVDQSDLLYLIVADRFANGDTNNDVIGGMRESVCDRNAPYGRHGGDIQGIMNHLDDLHNLGVSALWMCPLMENDQPRSSYHGYAITDHYAIDPRYGSNDDYARLVRLAHSKDMKVVMDVVYNHMGDHHRLYTSPPDSSWFHWWDEYTQTNAREVTLYDPYAAPSDRKRFQQGWFDRSMPDVNTTNPHCARYLVQNTLWWLEHAGVDGLRIDTYPYPEQQFMQKLNATVKRLYPNVFVFGETWVQSATSQATYLNSFPLAPRANLEASTDFPMHFALTDVLTKPSGWDEGVGRLYRVLASDYLYATPSKQVVFLDNHDLPRIFGVVGSDLQKMRMGLVMLYTMRGIPCITYGTEAAMRETREHGTIRQDMPGGWPSDMRSIWNARQRTSEEQECFDMLRQLGQYRKQSKPLTTGRLMQFAPENGLYTYVRYTNEEAVVVVVNADSIPRTLQTKRLDDVLGGVRVSKDILSNTNNTLQANEQIEPYGVRIWEMVRKR